jgi:hypothetical protein
MRTLIIISFILIPNLFSFARAETRVESLNQSTVIGRLGKPLGTRQVISGVLAEVTMLTNPLAVSKVNGQVLKEPVSIEIRGKAQIQKSISYQFEGYESGEFAGAPSWLTPEAQQPFQFRSFFVVTKVIKTKSRLRTGEHLNGE